MGRRPKAAEPIEAAEEPAPRDHNQPPEVLKADLGLSLDEWSEFMDHVFESAVAVLTPLLESDVRFKDQFPLRNARLADDPPFGIDKWSDDVQARATTLRERFRDVLKQIEALHALEKGPVLAAGRVIDAKKNALIQKIAIYDQRGRLLTGADAPLNRISDRCTVYANWIEQERRREARAEADRLEAIAKEVAEEASQSMEPKALQDAARTGIEAEAAREEAEAPAAALTRVHGTQGGVMSLRGRWEFVADESNLMELVKAVAAGEAPLDYLTFNETRLGYAVRTEKVREIPGCVIRESKRV